MMSCACGTLQLRSVVTVGLVPPRHCGVLHRVSSTPAARCVSPALHGGPAGARHGCECLPILSALIACSPNSPGLCLPPLSCTLLPLSRPLPQMSLPTPSPLPTHVAQDYFDKTRVLFGQHSGGYVVPVRMHLQLADDAFTGFIHPLACDEEFIFFLAESRTVCAATQTSMLLLGVCGWCLVLIACVASTASCCFLQEVGAVGSLLSSDDAGVLLCRMNRRRRLASATMK